MIEKMGGSVLQKKQRGGAASHKGIGDDRL